MVDLPERSERAPDGSLQIEVDGAPWPRLLLDTAGRLVRMEVYRDAERTELRAVWDYREHQEVAPGVWIAMLHEARLITPAGEVRETARFETYRTFDSAENEWFMSEGRFPGVRFTNTFDAIYGGDRGKTGLGPTGPLRDKSPRALAPPAPSRGRPRRRGSSRSRRGIGCGARRG